MVPTQKSSSLFVCECCNYSSSRKSQYQRHLETDKHKILQNPTSKKFQPEKLYICDCGKTYKHSSTLYAHKKNCNQEKEKEPTDKELIMMLIKDNSELKTMIMKVLENGVTNTNNSHNTTTTTNSHNKAFNLNFFLNETCKNAMNITDFVETIKLQLSDLEKFGEIGYVEGISNIIVKNLNDLDETLRPIHCTDKKRETMYIKDAGEWQKEDDNKSKLRRAIKNVANKNIRLLPQFRQKYPDYGDASSKVSDKYEKMVIEAMGGQGNNDVEKEDKIIHNISKATTISMK